MTEREMENPEVIRSDRLERISRGSGVPEERIEELLEQHSMMKRTMDQFGNMGDGDMQRMMKKLQQQGGEGGGGMGGMGGMGPFG